MAVRDMAITVAQARREEIDTVASAVRGCGVSVERIIPAIGAIYARGDEATMPQILAVSGVEAVREAGRVQLAPPDPASPQ